MPALATEPRARTADRLEPLRGRRRTRRLPAWALAAALALAWLVLAPPTPDLAAQDFRADSWAREGFQVYNPAWFAGHHLPGYSLLFPPLAALLGVRTVGVLCAVASTVLFARLAREAWGDRGRAASGWFAAASVADLCIGRITYALGVTLGLAALAALQARRTGLAALLAVSCGVGSPVAGAFLALAGTAVALGRGVAWQDGRPRVRSRAPAGASRDPLVSGGLAVAAAALTAVATLTLAFPEGGTLTMPFLPSVAVLGSSLAVLVLLPRGERTLRIATGLYLLTALGLILVATPMGSNVTRLGATFAGPVLLGAVAAAGGLAALRPGRRALLAVVLAGLAAWQWYAPVREMAKGAGDPSTQAAYFGGLVGFLREQAGPGGVPPRVEVPFTRGHWEAAHLARHVPLARGWATQLDRRYNGLFFAGGLNPRAYESWLRRTGVRFVALPDVPLDPAGRREAELVRGGPAFLRPVWRDAHWRVYAVRDPRPLVSGPATLEALGAGRFTVRVSRPGTVLVRLRHTRYWQPAGARSCVLRRRDGWTRILALEPGRITVRASLTAGRLFGGGAACTPGAGGAVD